MIHATVAELPELLTVVKGENQSRHIIISLDNFVLVLARAYCIQLRAIDVASLRNRSRFDFAYVYSLAKMASNETQEIPDVTQTQRPLPSSIRRRMLAMLKLQYQLMEYDVEYHRRLFQLESEINEKRQSIYAQRAAIVTGEYDPMDEAYTKSESILFNGFLTNLELTPPDYTEQSVGIPKFWSELLKHGSILYFHESDERILAYMTDIRLKMQTETVFSAALEFHFAKNPFFENDVLTKEFFLNMQLKEEKPFVFEGPEVYKSVGCEIKWKNNKDAKLHPESFFQLFVNSHIVENSDVNDDVAELLEGEFEMALFIKENFIPHAALFFISINNWNSSEEDIDSSGDSSDSDGLSSESTHDILNGWINLLAHIVHN